MKINRKSEILASITLMLSILLSSLGLSGCGKSENDQNVIIPSKPALISPYQRDNNTGLLDDTLQSVNDKRITCEDIILDSVRATYSFAYLNSDAKVFDKMGVQIGTIKKYQKVLVIADCGNLWHVEYSNNIGEISSGYVMSYKLTVLPDLFIEIDISEQTIRLYDNNELVLEAPVITGGPSTPTNEGCFEIYSMEENVTLKKYNEDGTLRYSHPVTRCMGYDGDYAIHPAEKVYDSETDAYYGWRDSDTFGGDTYLTNGSGGCTNTLEKTAKELYARVKKGTKVLIHE